MSSHRARSFRNAACASSPVRSPRCEERNASAPRATQKVLFSSAPAATTRPLQRHRQPQRRGRVAARAADREARADDRVLAAAVDRPVVGEEQVGDVAEAPSRLVVVEGDRLVGAVAARQHERTPGVRAEQVVERRVGKHQPQPRRAGRDGRSDRRARRRRRTSTIGPRGRSQQRQPRPESARRRERVGRHHRKRLLLAALPLAEPGTAVSLVASQARW